MATSAFSRSAGEGDGGGANGERDATTAKLDQPLHQCGVWWPLGLHRAMDMDIAEQRDTKDNRRAKKLGVKSAIDPQPALE